MNKLLILIAILLTLTSLTSAKVGIREDRSWKVTSQTEIGELMQVDIEKDLLKIGLKDEHKKDWAEKKYEKLYEKIEKKSLKSKYDDKITKINKYPVVLEIYDQEPNEFIHYDKEGNIIGYEPKDPNAMPFVDILVETIDLEYVDASKTKPKDELKDLTKYLKTHQKGVLKVGFGTIIVEIDAVQGLTFNLSPSAGEGDTAATPMKFSDIIEHFDNNPIDPYYVYFDEGELDWVWYAGSWGQFTGSRGSSDTFIEFDSGEDASGFGNGENVHPIDGHYPSYANCTKVNDTYFNDCDVTRYWGNYQEAITMYDNSDRSNTFSEYHRGMDANQTMLNNTVNFIEGSSSMETNSTADRWVIKANIKDDTSIGNCYMAENFIFSIYSNKSGLVLNTSEIRIRYGTLGRKFYYGNIWTHNEDMTNGATYNPTAINTTVGTHTGGDVDSINTPGLGCPQYTSYNVTEVTGTPGFEIYTNFTDVEIDTAANWDFKMEAEYDGNPAHDVFYQVYNYTADDWIELFQIPDGGCTSFLGQIQGSSDLISNGIVQTRTIHTSPGSAGHHLWISYMSLESNYTNKWRNYTISFRESELGIGTQCDNLDPQSCVDQPGYSSKRNSRHWSHVIDTAILTFSNSSGAQILIDKIGCEQPNPTPREIVPTVYLFPIRMYNYQDNGANSFYFNDTGKTIIYTGLEGTWQFTERSAPYNQWVWGTPPDGAENIQQSRLSFKWLTYDDGYAFIYFDGQAGNDQTAVQINGMHMSSSEPSGYLDGVQLRAYNTDVNNTWIKNTIWEQNGDWQGPYFYSEISNTEIDGFRYVPWGRMPETVNGLKLSLARGYMWNEAYTNRNFEILAWQEEGTLMFGRDYSFSSNITAQLINVKINDTVFVDGTEGRWATTSSYTPYCMHLNWGNTLKVIASDVDGNFVDGATVTLKDVNGDTIWTNSTDATGKSETTDVIWRTYWKNSAGLPICTAATDGTIWLYDTDSYDDHGPFTVTVSKAGYQDYVFVSTLNKTSDIFGYELQASLLAETSGGDVIVEFPFNNDLNSRKDKERLALFLLFGLTIAGFYVYAISKKEEEV